MATTLKTVSLFSGAGGLDLGLEAVGFTTVLATDIDNHSCITLAQAKKASRARRRKLLERTVVVQKDIRQLDPASILEATGLKRGELALLSGGPPCQAFSVFGRRLGRQDERGLLAFQYLRMLQHLRPQAFVFENVYGILTIENGRVFAEVCERLANPAPGLEYQLSVHRLDAVNFGVPQHRDRVFIIGHAAGRKVANLDPITMQCGITLFEAKPQWRTVADAFSGLPKVGSPYPPNHVGRVHSDAIIGRYAKLRPGERDPITRINKLDLHKPSFTIIVGSDKGGGKGHVHPSEPREVTARESARIQTFPDWWAFSGTSRHPIRQVGNAVPPLLASAVGNAMRTQLFGLPSVPMSEITDVLDQGHLFHRNGGGNG